MKTFELITAILVILKLVGSVTWSWWAILLPLFVAFILRLGIVLWSMYATRRYFKKVPGSKVGYWGDGV